MNKLAVFYHLWQSDDDTWLNIFKEQAELLKSSELINAADNIYIITNKPLVDDLGLSSFSNVTIEVDDDPTFQEKNTLKKLWEFSKTHEDWKLCYFHDKGATKPNDIHITHWRQCLNYFTIERWEDCVTVLDAQEDGSVGPLLLFSHYHGNFWWAWGHFVSSLSDYCFSATNRILAESWLCGRTESQYYEPDRIWKMVTPHRTGRNHYLFEYPRRRYDDEPLKYLFSDEVLDNGQVAEAHPRLYSEKSHIYFKKLVEAQMSI